MARKMSRPEPTLCEDLRPLRTDCPHCGRLMWADYSNQRTIATLSGLTRLNLSIRRCANPDCLAYRRPYRPEAEGRFALPRHEFGLDVIATVGSLRYGEHRSVPEIHRHLSGRGLAVCERSVSNLLDRYDELLALAGTASSRLNPLFEKQGRVILAIDGMQPDVGHEVLWVIRECLCGEVVLAKSLLSSTQDDLAALLRQAVEPLEVPVVGVVSDGQRSIRNAVAEALPGVPHQLCQFHFLREAALPIYEMDRNAKKELKKTVRGVRAIERQAESEGGAAAEAVKGYCAAVRSALTDDGRPPLDDNGLRLRERLEAVAASAERVVEKGGHPRR